MKSTEEIISDKHFSIAKTIFSKRVGIAFLLALLIVGGVLWKNSGNSSRPKGEGRNAAPTSVGIETIGKGDIGIIFNALGTVTSHATVTIKSQISGHITKIAFKEGEEIKKGDLLAEIDSRLYEAALSQAKAQLARDQALLKGAQVSLTRYQGLATNNAISRQTLDEQVALVAQDQALVASDNALVETAEINLTRCRIQSPIDGRAGLRQVDEGNYVTPSDTTGLVVITQLQPISVLFTLPEDNLPAVSKQLANGATLTVSAYDRSGAHKIADGVLESFDSQIDQTTGTIKMRATFSNETKSLFPNQFVNIKLLVDTHKNIIVASRAGIQRGIPGSFVYRLNPDNTVSVRKVELGVTEGDRIEIVSGLADGDQIVTDGTDKLRDGAKINIMKASSDTESAQTSHSHGEKHRKDNQQQ